ncbi:metallophosphoesterase [Rhodococcus tukisamuensis]|uniref:Calcineurin-like phosphoesterase n=1 Tax=Rhodococcus tukisamuensis TaxID=168276 RepID=A0A1G6SWS0_9NOCA|nr:metallophosphoesterase [Rhodococcus tukisamuensis]SDD21213.1 Calcineurin-like phosphoesterase [Rhodococcus tukisamuensis]
MTEFHGIDRRRFLAGAAAAGAVVPLAAMTPALAGATGATAGPDKFPFPTDSSLRVLLTGDAGTGTPAQWAVTDAIRDLHGRAPLSMALGLGDNIYELGPNGDDDVQFKTKFEDPNHGLDFPWVMALGNHDNSAIFPGDGGWLLRGDDEVDYHQRSRKWWMPSRFYSVRVPEQNPVVEFFVLDLNPLAAYLPPLLAPYWAPDGQFMNEQRAWLDAALASSTAKWKIAVTHHPYLSNGSHGDAGKYDGIPLEPMNGVHAKRFYEDHVVGRCQFILSGHDHSLQILEPTTASKGTRQIVSGAAGKNSHGKAGAEVGRNNLFQNHTDVGFMVMDLDRDAVTIRVYTVDIPTAKATVAFERRLA